MNNRPDDIEWLLTAPRAPGFCPELDVLGFVPVAGFRLRLPDGTEHELGQWLAGPRGECFARWFHDGSISWLTTLRNGAALITGDDEVSWPEGGLHHRAPGHGTLADEHAAHVEAAAAVSRSERSGIAPHASPEDVVLSHQTHTRMYANKGKAAAIVVPERPAPDAHPHDQIRWEARTVYAQRRARLHARIPLDELRTWPGDPVSTFDAIPVLIDEEAARLDALPLIPRDGRATEEELRTLEDLIRVQDVIAGLARTHADEPGER